MMYLIGVVTVLVVAMFWLSACNNRTLAEKRAMLDVMSSFIRSDTPEYFWPLARVEESVSYDRHLWALFFFRDPWRLYRADTSLGDIRYDGNMFLVRKNGLYIVIEPTQGDPA